MIYTKIVYLDVFVNLGQSINESIFLGEIQFRYLYQNIDGDKISNFYFLLLVMRF